MDFIDAVVYINLDRREDRRQWIEQELKRLGVPSEKVVRFPAIERNPGWIGCTLSHIGVLEMAKEKQWKNVMLLEDDFECIVSPEKFNTSLWEFFLSNTQFDVLFLSYNLFQGEEYNQLVGRVKNCQTASGFIVNERFYDTLLSCWKHGYTRHTENEHMNLEHLLTCDQYWKVLQEIPSYVWLYFKERIGIQRAGYSDLMNRYVRYGC
jgi:glycosyl transferase family 25